MVSLFSVGFLFFESMGYMALPTWLVLGTFLQHIGMTGAAGCPGRGHGKILKGAMALITFYHGDTVNRIKPFFLNGRRCLAMAIRTILQHLLLRQLGMDRFFFLPGCCRRNQPCQPQQGQDKSRKKYAFSDCSPYASSSSSAARWLSLVVPRPSSGFPPR